MVIKKSYKIGHYNIRHLISRDSHSSVLLAFDTKLDRQVVIKIFKDISIKQDGRLDPTIKEARSLSKLRHPNIISLYEMGEQKSIPYLVLEYFEGESLSDLIKRKKSLTVRDTVKMMSQILDGMAHAHHKGIVHNDLRPENILISDDGVPRIKDFGISMIVNDEKGANYKQKEILQYTAPECFLKGIINKSSDVYSLGLIFYEMLTSRPCIEADKRAFMIYKIAYEPAVHPSLDNPEVDPMLDGIVEKAIQKDPKARFKDAAEMKKAVDTYLELPGEDALQEPVISEDNQGILNFLLRRMKYNSDFPAFSKSIVAINEKTSNDPYTSARDLANIILKDYSLTNKILSLVNSSFYGKIGSGVTSIQQAVVILGLEQVRLMAGAMMVFTQIQDKSNLEELKDSMIKSFMSGLIALEVAKAAGAKKAEIGFLCAMFQTLGRNLTIYYLHEEYSDIKSLMDEKDIDMHSAAYEVLGASLDELGVCIARNWKFPEAIIYCMRGLPEGAVNKPHSKLEVIRHFSIFSNELCEVAGQTFNERSVNQLIQLMKRFESSISISEKDVFEILLNSIEKIKKYASVLGINAKKSQFINNLSGFAELGEKSELFANDGGVSAGKSSPDQPARKKDHNDASAQKTGGFHSRISPLLNKFVGKK